MSGFNLSSFTAKRTLIIDTLKRISTVSKELDVHTVSETIEKTIKELEKADFKIVIVGEFSRGKSTLINALLGRRVLPSSTKPTTTTLNKINYSQESKFRIHYRDSEQIDFISEEAFQKIVAPTEPIPGDESSEKEHQLALDQISKIAFTEIGYPTSICKEGVEIVDTPGTNDLDAAREEITYKFIPESDAAIVVLSARQPLADSEMRFIKDRILEADIQKIFFVINFKDYLRTEEERVKVSEYIKEHLEPVVKDPKIIMVSAKEAMNYRRESQGEVIKGKIPTTLEETGILQFEEILGKFLMEEKGIIKLTKPIERGVRLANQLKQDSIRLSLTTIGIPLQELEAKVEQLKPELTKARKISEQTINRLKVELEKSSFDIRSDFEAGLKLIADSAVRTIDSYEGPLTKEDIARTVERTIAPLQTDLQGRIRRNMNRILEEEIQRAHRRLETEWIALEQTITATLTHSNALVIQKNKNSLELSMEVGFDDGEAIVLTGLSSFGILALASALSISFVFVLPALFFGGKFLYSHFETKARERALGKVRVQIDRRFRDIIPEAVTKFNKDWNSLSDEAVTSFQKEIEQKVSVIETQLNKVLQERKKENQRVEQQKETLLKQEDILNQSIKLLTNISKELQTPSKYMVLER